MRATASQVVPSGSLARLAHKAAARIDAGALDEATLEELARDLGATSRQLRRAMRAELGLTPIAFAQATRLARARQLLEGPKVLVTDAAFDSGFRSLRRFNAAFARAHGRTPSQARHSTPQPIETLLLELPCDTAYDWPAMLRPLDASSVPGVELVSGLVYARTVRIGDQRGWLAVSPGRSRSALSAEVSLPLSRALPAVVSKLRRLLGLEAPACPSEPGDFDSFEASFKGILDKRRGGLVAEAFGEPMELPCALLTRLFPSARDLASASEEDLARCGVAIGAARRLLTLARRALEKEAT